MRRLSWIRSLPVLIAAALAPAGCGEPTPEPAADRAPAPAPSAPVAGRVYVSDETGGVVVAIDPVAGEIVTRIPVGKRPRGIRLSSDGARLFVALSGSPIAPPGVDESTLPPADRAAETLAVLQDCMRTRPAWAPDLPLGSAGIISPIFIKD